ncbi:MAG: HD domain-containing protein [Anaerolineales bacterium]|nr:MAG: HD domain-containing protein [Anaerolineales bacterium]
MDGGPKCHAPVDFQEEKGPWVSELGPGQEFIGFYVARNPRLEPFRDPTKGKYMRMQLVDRSGAVQARIWEEAEQASEQILDGIPLKIDGLIELYNEELQVQIRRFRPARSGEVRREDMINTSRRDPEMMWLTVQEAIQQVKDPCLTALLRYFYDSLPTAARLLEVPAARVIHRSYMRGLLEHSYELLMLATPLLALYPEIDRDLLVTGILLHDIGKLEEYDFDFDISVTDAGKLIGHVVLSERMVSRAIRSIEGFPEKREQQLLHLVISHHGRYEWGAARRPKSLEAIALHHLDNLDAQVNRFNLLLAAARENGKTWTDYDRMLGRMLYAGNQNGLGLEENSYLE